ncbi:CAP domain-containing protein [Syncephalis fuscata]|nr:CAP domain-containing protein [Syncephalis fuscata]
MHAKLLVIASLALLTTQYAVTAYDRNLMLCLVNQERANRGLWALGPNAALDNASQRHSDDQARNKFMDHNGSDGSRPQDRIDATGYKWTAFRENVAFGQKDERDVMKAWMESTGHRDNILANNIYHLGSAVAYNGNVGYYTQNFGSDGTKPSYPSCPSSYSTGYSAPSPPPSTYGEAKMSYAPESSYSDYSTYSYSTSSDESYSDESDSDDSYVDTPSTYSTAPATSYAPKSSYKSTQTQSSTTYETPGWNCTKKDSNGKCYHWKKCTGNSASWSCEEKWTSL